MSKLLDANAILRYLINDIEDQANRTEEAISEGAFTIPEVLAEVVYVLEGVYKQSKKKITETLIVLLDEIDITDKILFFKALEIYGNNNLDYVDCVILARALFRGDHILTYDKKMISYLKKHND